MNKNKQQPFAKMMISDLIKALLLILVLLGVFFSFIALPKLQEKGAALDIEFNPIKVALPRYGIDTSGQKAPCPLEAEKLTCRLPSIEDRFLIDDLTIMEKSRINWKRYVETGKLPYSLADRKK